MLRKLVSATIVFALTSLGLSSVSPAQAAAAFSPSVSVPSNAYRGSVIPFSDEASLLVWIDGDDNGRYLRSGLLHRDGTFDSQTTIFQGSTSTQIYENPTGSWAVLPDGTVAYTWSYAVTDWGTQTNTSYLNVAYTQDGKEWSAPIQVFQPKVITDGGPDCYFRGCGFTDSRIAYDANGTLAIAAQYVTRTTREVIASTSLDGVNWNSGSQLFVGGAVQYPVLKALPNGGFILVWQFHDGNNWNIQYSTTGKINFWTRAKTLGAGVIEREPVLGQTSATELSMFTITADNVIPILHQQVFNFVDRTWGASNAILTMPTGWTSGDPVFSLGKNWHSAVAVSNTGNGTNTGYAGMVEMRNSVPQLPKTIATTTAEPSMAVPALRVNSDDSITALIKGTDVPSKILTISSGEIISSTEVPLNAKSQVWAMTATVSPNGNIFLVAGTGGGIYEGMAYVGASKPQAAGALKVAGTAKNGKQLVATLPTFSSVSDIGVTTMQWYACASKVTVVQITIPAGCVPIPKAVTAKFKVTAKQKNKFLALAVTNTNRVGTTILFSPTTAKAK